MPAVGKEIEHPLTPEALSQPVEQMGYVEKVEKQVETQQRANPQPQQKQETVDSQLGDMGKVVSAQFAGVTKSNIVLPLDQEEVAEGLHHKVWESARWLSEWCVMMIKKYPGRVFYLPPETT
ncbi:MAG: hypothetical protein UV35_C0035G0002 [candidate division WWE3 bacterium GW2011_GWB1_42_6]|uniref:Uncharacterized protein n=1 Tax=candidate division WWE3 bacterium GW2011_GWB1_42_6 TaxID=1619115 RepID=A0A0G1AXM2_UNCKA|nr:MAG: hypothetical protein UV35_C0035G0002 [candidate division WWE3 bacterium GW2011_GWB1_42_6]